MNNLTPPLLRGGSNTCNPWTADYADFADRFFRAIRIIRGQKLWLL
jgi:hypothetical protein